MPPPGKTVTLGAASLLLLLAGAGCSAPAEAPESAGGPGGTIVATVGGQEISLAQLDERAQAQNLQTYQALYDARRQALDSMVSEKLLDRAAEKRGLTRDALLEQEVKSKLSPPTAAQVGEFYEQNRASMGGRTLDEVREQIRQYMANQAGQRAMRLFLASLAQESPVAITLVPPRVPVTVGANDPVKGPAGAPVQIVEFSDFQCPYCAKVGPTLDRLFERYGDRIQLAFRDFPLSFHDRALAAAEAAQCAHAQGKFWEFHDKLFQNQQALGDEDLERFARELGLDLAAFTACTTSARYRSDVQADMVDGQRFGVQGTPSLFVNGRFLSGPSYEQLTQIIDEELKSKGIASP
jgi:protein-disulfide isomerase